MRVYGDLNEEETHEYGHIQMFLSAIEPGDFERFEDYFQHLREHLIRRVALRLDVKHESANLYADEAENRVYLVEEARRPSDDHME